jgi:hypothetical protein
MLALRVMEPAQLLQDFGVVRVTVEDAVVSHLRIFKLASVRTRHRGAATANTYVFLLLMNVANLKPDILFRERRRRRVHDVLETLRGSSQQLAIAF